MSDHITENEMDQWCQTLADYHLPRWNELPDISLYMDQVVTLIEKYVRFLALNDDKLITSAMINNYVKLGLMPKPEKKRYERSHLAYLIVITLLKQILTIPEIKDGILLQCRLCSMANAYDLFCQELEYALKRVATVARSLSEATLLPEENLSRENLAVKMVCNAYACKLVTEKILFFRRETLLDDSTEQGSKQKGASS